MQLFWWSILSVGLAAATCALLTPLVIRAAQMLGLVDQPGPRKVHKHPIPRVGGVAIAFGTLIGACVTLSVPWVRANLDPNVSHDLLVVFITSGLILLLGVVDDVFNISAKFKLIGLVGASAALCAADIRIENISFEGAVIYEFGWVAWPLTIFWIIGITVAINFIDGLDGLAGGVCAITALTLAIVAGYHLHLETQLVALAITGALIGFLVHNWHPARVFMGDGGSMFLGFTLASLTVMSGRGHGTFSGLIVPTLPLALPIIDTALTIVRRNILQRRSVFSAEQGHVHHRLIAIGLCQQHAVLLFYAVSAIASVSALLLLFGSLWLKAIGLISVVAMVVAVLRIAESVGLQETLQAFRRNRKLFRESKRLQHLFEDQQLQFRHVKDFEGWWRQVCKAAEAFEFVQMKLPVTDRDGKTIVRKWCAGDGQFDDAEVLAASVPVKQRRIGSTLKIEVHLGPSNYLEAASERLTMFSRLMDEHSIARLVGTRQHNPTYRQATAIEPVLAKLSGTDGMGSFPPRDPVFAAPPESPQGMPVAASDARIAIVHDFLYTYAGAERVLEQLLELYPNADVFSLFDFVDPAKRAFLKGKPVTTSFIQKMPLAKRHHRLYLPLMPLAIEQLDVANYDIVISSSYVAAKGVITRPGQLHVCYCHTPVRIAWDQQNQYLNTVGLTFGLKAMLSRMILHYIRTWDVRSANGVDVFLTNSDFVGRRIEKVYRRKATTIYPPVAIEKFGLQVEKQDFYVTASRLVPYKRIDLIVEAFTQTPHRRLIVVGDGPEMERIKAKAGPNISLVGYQNDEALKRYMQHARAFVFAAEEDFGIVPVEAQACGTPVIACGRGGVGESVIDGKTGVFFHEQSVDALVAAVDRFESMTLEPAEIYKNAQRFSSERFRQEIGDKVQAAWHHHRTRQLGVAAEVKLLDSSIDDDRLDDEVEVAGV